VKVPKSFIVVVLPEVKGKMLGASKLRHLRYTGKR